MKTPKRIARKGAALITASVLLLSGCQENTVVENGDLPQSIDVQNDLTTITTVQITTTTTTKATTTTTTTAETTTTTTAEEAPDENTGTASETASETASDPAPETSGELVTAAPAPVTSAATASALPSTASANTAAAATTAATTAPPATTTTVITTARQHVCGYRGGNTYPEFKHDLQYMYDLNSDFIGWLKVKDTPIDGPVVQATDNKFYLEHDFYGRLDSSLKCVTYADYHVPVTANSGPQNLILYGHNISSGAGLAKISNYNPNYYGSLNFYLTHPTLRYESIYGGEYRYVVFAGMFVNTETKHGSVFNYHKYRDFGSESLFYQYFEAVFDRSVFYNPGIDISYNDQFLTISTCWYPLGIDTRFVLFCRRLRDGESPEIDVSKAYINKSPLYFDYYYKVNGGKWAGRSWPSSLMAGYQDWLDAKNAQ